MSLLNFYNKKVKENKTYIENKLNIYEEIFMKK